MTAIELPGRLLSALLRCVSRDDARTTINGVFFDSAGFAVATDGHILMAAKIAAFDGPSFRVARRVLDAQLKVFSMKARMSMDFPIDRTEERVAEGHGFPQWREVYPKSLSGDPAQYDDVLIARVRAAIGDATSSKKKQAVEMLTNGSDAGLAVAPEGLAFIVMPFRTGSDEETRKATGAALAFIGA